MADIKVVVWSGTGNTAAMAEAVADGIRAAGGNPSVVGFNEISVDDLASADRFALGCPAMGAEQLEESEVEPLFSDLESRLSGKKVALFGSYGWGSGEWMNLWADRVTAAGATLINGEGLIAHEAPDDAALADCKALGEALAKA